MAYLLNEVDIFADLSSFQAMGLTALEAMACGVAVIVPEKGGAGTFARAGSNCLVADTTSVAAAAGTLETLVTDHELRVKLQAQAVRDSAQYYPEQAAFRMLEALFPGVRA
jgi:glycosyltransferase involved in cell wall biosynthesis